MFICSFHLENLLFLDVEPIIARCVVLQEVDSKSRKMPNAGSVFDQLLAAMNVRDVAVNVGNNLLIIFSNETVEDENRNVFLAGVRGPRIRVDVTAARFDLAMQFRPFQNRKEDVLDFRVRFHYDAI